MKTTITTIINGEVLGKESRSFGTKTEYDNFINGLIDYITDKEVEVKLNHERFTEKTIDFLGDPVSFFSSHSFMSIMMGPTITWRENGVITICTVENETSINIGSSDKPEVM